MVLVFLHVLCWNSSCSVIGWRSMSLSIIIVRSRSDGEYNVKWNRPKIINFIQINLEMLWFCRTRNEVETYSFTPHTILNSIPNCKPLEKERPYSHRYSSDRWAHRKLWNITSESSSKHRTNYHTLWL